MNRITPLLTLVVLLAPSLAVGQEKQMCSEEPLACMRAMVEHARNRGWVGIELSNPEEASGEVRIEKVLSGSPGEKAGIQAGDVVTALNSVPYSADNEVALKKEFRAFTPGKVVVFSVLRDGKAMEIKVTLGRVPDHIVAQWLGEHMLHHHLAGDP